MRRLLLGLLLPLALAPAASAKGPLSLKVCGQGGACHAVRDHRSLAAYERGLSDTLAPGHREAFFRVRVTIGGRDMPEPVVDRVAWLPRQGLVRGQDDTGTVSWTAVRGPAAAVLRRAAHGLAPLPAAALPVVHRPVARVDEVVAPPAPAHERGGGPSGWWAPLAIVPVAALAALRRRRSLP